MMQAKDTTQQGRVKRAIAYKRILLDKRIPHGAFRLYHLLRDHDGARGCFPGLRCLARELGSSQVVVRGWRDQLRRLGYIQATVRLGCRTIFQLHPKPDAVTASRTGHSTASETGCGTASETGCETKPKNINPRTKGPRLFPNEVRKELSELRAELKSLPLSADAKITGLLARIHVLEVQKFGYEKTLDPRAKKQSHPAGSARSARNSFADTPKPLVQQFVADAAKAIDCPS